MCHHRHSCGGHTIMSLSSWLQWSRHCIIIVVVTVVVLLCHRHHGHGGRTIASLLSWLQWSCHRIIIVTVAVAAPSCCCCCCGRSGHAIVSSLLSQLHRLCSDFGHHCHWTTVGEGKVFLGLKVPYLVMVIRSDCLEFGLHNSCPSPSRVTFVACFPFFLLTE